MDFKTRFQGKTSHITRDGGISDIVKQSTVPISKGAEGSRITVVNPNAHQQLISYGSGFNEGSQSYTNSRASNNYTYYDEGNQHLSESPLS